MNTFVSDPVQVAPPRTNGWFQRNWKWFAWGCLTTVALAAIFVLAVLGIVMFSLKSSDVYKSAVAKAQSNQEVIERLGAPVQPKWYVLGSIQLHNRSGDVDLTIPIVGPKNTGSIHAVGVKNQGEWRITEMRVSYQDSENTTNLLSAEPSQQLY